MASLSLNTSITSSHKSDFYSGIITDVNNNDYVAMYDIYGNYFTDINTPVPCDDMVIYARTNISQNWKEISRYNMCGYYGYCYIHLNYVYGFYYNYSNPSDTDNWQLYDKLKVYYDGTTVESFINRTNLNIRTVDINNNSIGNSSISISCYSNCASPIPDINTNSDSNGNVISTFFNPPKAGYDPHVNRIYRINATKNTLSGYKDEVIPNQQYYPSEQTSLNIQLICYESPQCTLNIID